MSSQVLRKSNHTIGTSDFTIIGGDVRQIFMALDLIELGYFVTLYALDLSTYIPLPESTNNFNYEEFFHTADSLAEAMKASNFIIAPIPLSRDGSHITSLVVKEDLTYMNFKKHLDETKVLLGGGLSEDMIKYCEENNVIHYDYMENDNVAIKNAIATAEGTIMEAIKRSNYNLHGSQSLILGFGRCAKILAAKLKAMDSHVTIAARKQEDLSYGYAYGYDTILFHDLDQHLGTYHYVFNTVPALVLTEGYLAQLRKDVTIIDIASAPGGTDFSATKALGLNASLCLGLPGKVAPKTSANILVEETMSIYHSLE